MIEKWILTCIWLSLVPFTNLKSQTGLTDQQVKSYLSGSDAEDHLKGKCGDGIDLRYWTQQGDTTAVPAKAVWQVDSSGASATQLVNASPASFFIASEDRINFEITGTVAVNSSIDHDNVGFVLGYQSPDSVFGDSIYTFLLIDWRGAGQSLMPSQCYAAEGYYLSKASGLPASDPADLHPYLGCHSENLPWFEILATDTGTGKGWLPFEPYQIHLKYTANHILFEVDGDTIFQQNGCFEAGKFGFYNNSQDHTVYSDFYSRPAFDFTLDNQMVCVNEAVTFSLSCNGQADITSTLTSIEWHFGDGSTLYLDSNLQLATSSSHSYSNHGIYQVAMILGSDQFCKDTSFMSVLVLPSYRDTIDAEICSDEEYFAGGAWQNEAGHYSDTIHSSRGCDSIVVTQLHVFALPDVSLEDDTACQMESIELRVQTGASNYVTWSTGETGISTIVTPEEDLVVYTEVRDQHGCITLDSLSVFIVHHRIKAFAERSTINAGESVQLLAAGDSRKAQYRWLPTTGLDDPDIKNPVASPTTTTMYTVFMEDKNSCRVSDTITIHVLEARDIQIPTGFTPNDDGMNDLFRPFLSTDIVLRSLRVADRWGRQVYSYPFQNPYPHWDGRFEGLPQPMGSYVYMMELESIVSGEVFWRQGNVTLLR